MRATRTLNEEHNIILKAAEIFERLHHRIQKNGDLDRSALTKLIEFDREFSIRCHHEKEERYLFPRLREYGVPDHQGLISELLLEHEQFRQMMIDLSVIIKTEKPLPPSALDEADRLIGSFVSLIREHIDEEDHILFPAADQILIPAHQDFLSEAFERFEIEETGAGVHEKYHGMIKELDASV